MFVLCLQGLWRRSFLRSAQNVIFKRQRPRFEMSFSRKCSSLWWNQICVLHENIALSKQNKNSLPCASMHIINEIMERQKTTLFFWLRVKREQDAVTHSNTLGIVINSNKRALRPVTIYHLSLGCILGERKEKMEFCGNTQSLLSPTVRNNNHEILIRL